MCNCFKTNYDKQAMFKDFFNKSLICKSINLLNLKNYLIISSVECSFESISN